MLSADKDKLEREYRKRMLQIRERELVYYISNSNNIATLSALLLGCTVSFLIDQANESFDLNCVDLSSGDDILDCSEQVLLGNGGQGITHYVSELLLPFLILFCTFQTSLSCWGSMLISMLAPRLALHGPPSHFSYVVDAVEEEFEHLRSILATSLATFMVIPLFWAFANLHEGLAFLLPARVQIERRSIINRHEGVASLLSVLFIVLLLLLRVVFVRLERSFVLPDAKKITGRWFARRFSRMSATPPRRLRRRERPDGRPYERLRDGGADCHSEASHPNSAPSQSATSHCSWVGTWVGSAGTSGGALSAHRDTGSNRPSSAASSRWSDDSDRSDSGSSEWSGSKDGAEAAAAEERSRPQPTLRDLFHHGDGLVLRRDRSQEPGSGGGGGGGGARPLQLSEVKSGQLIRLRPQQPKLRQGEDPVAAALRHAQPQVDGSPRDGVSLDGKLSLTVVRASPTGAVRPSPRGSPPLQQLAPPRPRRRRSSAGGPSSVVLVRQQDGSWAPSQESTSSKGEM